MVLVASYRKGGGEWNLRDPGPLWHQRNLVLNSEVWQSGNNSVVECDLAKVEVAGSNPVSRSKLYRRGPGLRAKRSAKLTSSDGAVAKW